MVTLRFPFSDFKEDSDAQVASGPAVVRFGSLGIAPFGGRDNERNAQAMLGMSPCHRKSRR
jgi:hypothetical protein